MSDFYEYEYVSAAERRRRADKKMRALKKQGMEIAPLGPLKHRIKIATSFWGHGWCRHLESFSDYESRLPRGRSYARNGSVLHLSIETGEIHAMVMGSELYEITIRIDPLPARKWKALQKACRGRIGSMVALLKGELSEEVMGVVANREKGLFPSPKEIHLDCNCPDYADLCKHLAAVLYGVGARLDESPELLFKLRGVQHEELLVMEESFSDTPKRGGRKRLSAESVEAVFGVEMDEAPPTPRKRTAKRAATPKPAAKPRKRKVKRVE